MVPSKIRTFVSHLYFTEYIRTFLTKSDPENDVIAFSITFEPILFEHEKGALGV